MLLLLIFLQQKKSETKPQHAVQHWPFFLSFFTFFYFFYIILFQFIFCQKKWYKTAACRPHRPSNVFIFSYYYFICFYFSFISAYFLQNKRGTKPQHVAPHWPFTLILFIFFDFLNKKVVQNRSMPFRALEDGQAIIFRHSYWHGQVFFFFF